MRRAGFTIIELLAIIIVVIALLIAAAVAISPQPHRGHRQLRDATQVRGIQQALITWASNNDDQFPLPSTIDKDNFTVPELGRAKDTTANILSILICEGFITSELAVSPQDINDRIMPYDNYEVEQPAGAVDPDKALWDPKFSADFTSESGGHNSYAHLIPQGKRLEEWTYTFKPDKAILSNRGPEMRAVELAGGRVVTRFANPATNTTRFFKGSAHKRDWWSGNVAFNDNHVELVSNLYADGQPVGDAKANPRLYLPGTDGKLTGFHDVLFADEQPPEGDDAHRDAYDANQFLGIFTTAGENREDFTAIWD